LIIKVVQEHTIALPKVTALSYGEVTQAPIGPIEKKPKGAALMTQKELVILF
jgi:hypothetical protein